MIQETFQISPLSDNELSRLVNCLSVYDRESTDWKKTWVILLSAAGVKPNRIARTNKISSSTIHNWLFSYEISRRQG